MVTPATAPSTSAATESSRLVDVARACKGAARAVTLYPDGHPSMVATLKRIVALTSGEALSGPLAFTATPDSLAVDGCGATKPEAATVEFAALLHSHGIGRLVIHPGGDARAWHRFLRLLGRDPQAVRAEGGFARAWAATGGDHVEVREIDYAEALRERTAGEAAAASWERIVTNCLAGSLDDLDDDAWQELIEAARNGEGLAALLSAVDRAPDESASADTKAATLLRILQRIVGSLASGETERLECVLRATAAAVEQLSPDVLLSLIRSATDRDPALVDALMSRISDEDVARFVARHVGSNAAGERLAEAFRVLAPDSDHQERLLTLARHVAAESPLGKASNFEAMWNRTAEQLVAAYSDEPQGSDYGRQLSAARMRAIEIEEARDDPPDRIRAWRDTVTATALRSLDLLLLQDLLRIDCDVARWGTLMTPVVQLLEDLFLVGDFDAARQLVDALAREAGNAQSERRSHAVDAIDLLTDGLMVRHLTAHLATIDDGQFAVALAMCLSIGTGIVRPLAETLSTEDRPQTRERLTSILVAFGPRARMPLEQLRSSPNLAIRRTALYLLRELGGSDVLPSVDDVLGGDDAQVQREALRSIIRSGSDRACGVLVEALRAARPRARGAIVQAVCGVRDEKVAPLLAYLVRHVDRRGAWTPIVVRAIEALGICGDRSAVGLLREVLTDGAWWAPRRTALLRSAAAAALARIGTGDAIDALEAVSARGPRGARTAARAQLEAARAIRAHTAEDQA